MRDNKDINMVPSNPKNNNKNIGEVVNSIIDAFMAPAFLICAIVVLIVAIKDDELSKNPLVQSTVPTLIGTAGALSKPNK